MAEAETAQAFVLIDAGVFIGALLNGYLRHVEARSLVEQARQGTLSACTTTSILRRGVWGLDVGESRAPARPSRGG